MVDEDGYDRKREKAPAMMLASITQDKKPLFANPSRQRQYDEVKRHSRLE
jgi:hypothetical protein